MDAEEELERKQWLGRHVLVRRPGGYVFTGTVISVGRVPDLRIGGLPFGTPEDYEWYKARQEMRGDNFLARIEWHDLAGNRLTQVRSTSELVSVERDLDRCAPVEV